MTSSLAASPDLDDAAREDFVPVPPSSHLIPYIALGVEHALELLSEAPGIHPFILAMTADGERGMWEAPGATPETIGEVIEQIEPTPEMAIAVIEGELTEDTGPRPVLMAISFAAGEELSTALVFPYNPAVPSFGMPATREDVEPMLVGNGPNPLR